MNFSSVIVVAGKRAAGWSQAMASEIHAALKAHHVPSGLVDIDNLPVYCAENADRQDSTLFVDFNHKTAFPWRQRKVSMMVDHPCSCIGQLSTPHSNDAITGWVDASHPAALKALGFSHSTFFLPHAGPPPSGTIRPFQDRDIDVFFSGTLAEPIDRATWSKQNPRVSPIVFDLLFDTMDFIETESVAVIPAFLEIARRRGVAVSAFSRDNFIEMISLILKFGELNRRVNVLSALPENLKIVIAPDYLPAVLRDRPNIKHLGYLHDFDEIRALMRNARIVLNTTLKFPGGSHERIWYAMAEGAVVLTDRSVFMEQDFHAAESIVYLPQKRLETADLVFINRLIESPVQLSRMADQARGAYEAGHTWTKRAPILIEALKAA